MTFFSQSPRLQNSSRLLPSSLPLSMRLARPSDPWPPGIFVSVSSLPFSFQTFVTCHPDRYDGPPSGFPATSSCCLLPGCLYHIHSEDSSSASKTKSSRMPILLFNKIRRPCLFLLSASKAGCSLSPKHIYIYPMSSLNKYFPSAVSISAPLQDLDTRR